MTVQQPLLRSEDDPGRWYKKEQRWGLVVENSRHELVAYDRAQEVIDQPLYGHVTLRGRAA